MIIFAESPTLHLYDQVLKTGETIQASIIGHPESNMTCSYKECPLVPGSKWPVTEKCTTSQIVPVQLTAQATDFVQHATFGFKLNSPGILSCDAANLRGSVSKSVNIYIQDFEQDLKILIPDEVVEGDKLEIVCFASKYNFTKSGKLQRSDLGGLTNIGELILVLKIMHT